MVAQEHWGGSSTLGAQCHFPPGSRSGVGSPEVERLKDCLLSRLSTRYPALAKPFEASSHSCNQMLLWQQAK